MRFLPRAASAASVLALAAGAAHADGFKVQEYSVRDLGLANSGNAALAADATTIWANPAGLMRLEERQVNLGAHYIIGRGEFENQGSVDALGDPIAGVGADDLFDDKAVPNLYAAFPLDDRVAVGLGVSAPFGLSTQYDPAFVGRYQAVESDLRVIDINPSVAVAVTDTLSLGIGLSVQYAEADLSNAIDFGALCLASAPAAACADAGLAPQQADGYVELSGDNWDLGWNVGLLFEPEEGTRVGFAYRSGVKHDLDGEADYQLPANAAATFAPAFADTDAVAPLDLPGRASVSLHHQATERWAFTGDVTWTQWSDLDALYVQYENAAQPDTAERLNYENSVRYSLGAEYDFRPDLVLRAGLAFDDSPTAPGLRSARVPDADRTVAALGASWTPREDVTLDVGYQHLFFDDAPIDSEGASGDRLVGEYDNAADILGAALNWRF